MTNRSAIIVGLRCFLIYATLQICAFLLFGMFNLSFVYAGLMALLLIPLVLLLTFSEPFVDFLTPRSNEVLADTNFTLSDLQAVAFSAIGLFIVYNAITDTIALLGALGKSQEMFGAPYAIDVSFYAKPIVGWIFGLYLLFGGRTLRGFLKRLREAHPHN